MANVFISIPVLDQPELPMMYNFYGAILSCKAHQCRVYFNSQDSLISRVRSVHLSKFYYDHPECEYFVSIDSDLAIGNIFPSNNMITKLVSHDLDMVGGLYAVKKQGVKQCASITIDGSPPVYDSGLKEMRWMSTGCWCLKRSMVKKMIEAYPELTYNGDDNAAGKTVHYLFAPMLYDIKETDFANVKLPFRKLLSEDWAYCQRWTDLGGKIYADTSIILNHIGKYAYSLFDVELVQE